MSKKNEVVSMHQLSEEFLTLMEVFEEVGGELSEELEARLATFEKALIAKTDNVVDWVKYQEGIISLADERAKKLKELKDQINKRLSNFENYLGDCIKRMNLEVINGEMYTIKLRKPAQVVYIEDEKKLPIEFLVIPEPEPAKPDLKAIKKAIDSGEEVAGALVVPSKKISVIYGFKK